MKPSPTLIVENLRTYFYARRKRAFIRCVDGIDMSIAQGTTLGIVGESGSGKSVTALSIMGLIEDDPGVISGRARLTLENGETNLLNGLDNCVALHTRKSKIVSVSKNLRKWRRQVAATMQPVRGRGIAMIFQDARSALNPFAGIGRQICEAVVLNTKIKGKAKAHEQTLNWMDKVRIDDPASRFHSKPHELSGGMCQRAMIAMAMACEPKLMIADEPTTGLDATIQSRIVDLMAELKTSIGTTTILISHDIDVIKALSDQVMVMYGGIALEQGPARLILDPNAEPKHPYTAALLASIPDIHLIRGKGALKTIKGDVLDSIDIPSGCRFYPRCSFASPGIRHLCSTREPRLRELKEGHRIRCWLYATV